MGFFGKKLSQIAAFGKKLYENRSKVGQKINHVLSNVVNTGSRVLDVAAAVNPAYGVAASAAKLAGGVLTHLDGNRPRNAATEIGNISKTMGYEKLGNDIQTAASFA